jgi:hypothetical protein
VEVETGLEVRVRVEVETGLEVRVRVATMVQRGGICIRRANVV